MCISHQCSVVNVLSYQTVTNDTVLQYVDGGVITYRLYNEDLWWHW